MPEYKPKPSRPPLFQEIVDNDERIRLAKQEPIDFKVLKELTDVKRELIRAAEKALSWNKDKGNG